MAEADARRGSARQRGYDARWDKAAKAFKRDHPLCLGCEAVGRTSAAEIVDHIEPHKGDPGLFWDVGNWQASCRGHHDQVKQRLEAMLAQGKATMADMRLNSALAIALTRDLMLRE